MLMLLPALTAAATETTDSIDEFDAIVESVIAVRDAAAKGKKHVAESQSAAIALSGIKVEEMEGDTIGAPESPFTELWRLTVELADSAKTEGTKRGDRNPASVTTRRFHVAKGSSAKIRLHSSKKLSVAAVPEAGARVTMLLHAHNRHGYDQHFDDTEKFHQGKNYRKKNIRLPESPTKVEIEVLNRSPKDISFILITK